LILIKAILQTHTQFRTPMSQKKTDVQHIAGGSRQHLKALQNVS